MEEKIAEIVKIIDSMNPKDRADVIADLKIHRAHLLAASEDLREAHPQVWSELAPLADLPDPFQSLMQQTP